MLDSLNLRRRCFRSHPPPRGCVQCPIIFNRFSVVLFPRSNWLFQLSAYFFFTTASFRPSLSVVACLLLSRSFKPHSSLTGPPMGPLLPTPAAVSPITFSLPSISISSLVLSEASQLFLTLSCNWSPGYVNHRKSAPLNCGVLEPFLTRIFLLWTVVAPLASSPLARPLDLICSGLIHEGSRCGKWQSIADSLHS